MDTDRISEAAESALEKTQDAAGRVRDALAEATDRGSELVEQRPGSALLGNTGASPEGSRSPLGPTICPKSHDFLP